MIVNRYLLKELLTTLLAVGVVLMLIFIAGQFVALLNEAATEAMPAEDIARLMVLRNLRNVAILMPVAFFFAVMLSLGRLYKDSEMAALNACGVGPGRVLALMLTVAAVLAVPEALLTFWANPWSETQSEAVERRLEAGADTRGLEPGHFKEASGAQGVFYFESLAPDGRTMRNVFVQSPQPEGELVVSAATGHLYVDRLTGVRYLILEDGYRYTGTPGTAGYSIIRFKRHAVRLYEREVQGGESLDSMPTAALWGATDRHLITELQWRSTPPLMLLVLSVLAVPLSRTSPRQGRYGKFFMGLVLYIVYNNLISIARAWLDKGQIPPEAGLWWVHGLFLALALGLLLRQSGWGYLRWRLAGERG